MPSTTPLTDAINALTTYANTTTGESDTTLSDAVATLIAGYGSGGGSSAPKLIKQIDFTPETTYTNSNRGVFNLEPLTSGQATSIVVNIDTYPSVPDESEYIALSYAYFKLKGGGSSTNTAILRPAGTIGADTSMCSYSENTGEFSVGGSFGHFMAGTTYHIYQFLINAPQ